MIANERQQQIGKAPVAEFRAAIDAPSSSTRTRHALAQKVPREAARTQIDEPLVEVVDYELLRDGRPTANTADPIADPAPTLTKTLIMRAWTQ